MSDVTSVQTAAEDKRRMLAELLKKKAAAPKTFPVSFAQQRVWFLAQLDPEGAAYNIEMTMRLRGPFDAALMRRVLNEVVARHESLRTRIETRDGEPVQVVEPKLTLEVPVLEMSGGERTEVETRIRDHVQGSLATPFALDRAPLFRADVLRVDDGESFLSVVFHHAIVDGWAQQVIQREIVTLYRAYAAGLPSPLAPVALQYADFAVWQREQLSGDALEAQIAFWRDTLDGAPPAIDLPTDRPRPDVAGHAGNTLHFHTGETGHHDAVNAFLLEEGATAFVGFLAIYGVILHRWSGQDRIVVGTPVLGRPRQELEGVVGYFANTLALHLDLRGDPTFRELLRRVRTSMLHAFEHADLPFEKLVEELRVERSLRQNPLYQVMFSFGGIKGALDKAPASKAEDAEPVDELRFLPVLIQGSVAQAEVSLTVTADRGRYYSGVEFRTELFDDRSMERFGRQVAATMRSVLATPDARISQLEILNDPQREELREMAAAPAAHPRDVPVHRLVSARAAEAPDAVAIVFEGETVTYGQLDARSDALARRLRAAGVGAETRVGVYLRHSVEAVVSLFAVLKAGGTYVPLDPANPADRIAFLVGDAGIRAVLTTPALRASLPATDAAVLLVSELESGDAGSSDPLPEVDADQAAYVIYTSGSTGVPKGVVVPHGAFAGSVLAMVDATEMTAADRYLLFASLSFDASLEQISTPLVSGASLALRGPELWLPDDVPAWVEMLGITCAEIPPAYLRHVLDDPERVARLRRRLRFVMVSGEAVAPEVARAWLQGDENARMLNAYGPTETAITATVADLRGPGDPAPHGTVSIGRQVGDRTAYVMDPGGHHAPMIVPGELCVGGPLLARGYHGRPALTAQSFVPDPFSTVPGARMYRTGDRVRRLPDGTLEFSGRFDDQVKVRGFRIELGEVEAALRAHPGVADAVAAVQGQGADARLVGYVVPAPGLVLDAAAVRDALVESLPEHLAPSVVVVLDAVPMTPTGKVDRRALPVPSAAATRKGEAYVAPRTETERVLADIWAEVLGAEQVGVRDHFFELGGHSLLATRVVSRIRQALGVEMPLRTLFEHPTVALLAGWLGDGAPAADAVSLVPIPRLGATRAAASFAQERLWFFDRLAPGGTAYNMQSVLPVRGAEPAVLRRVLDEVARRHESLRTTFDEHEGHAYQVIHPAIDIPLEVVDVSHLPPAEREAAARRVMGDDAMRPYDLRTGPLYRVTLVDLGDAQLLVTGMHHIIGDGWSLDVLEKEIPQIYAAFKEGRPSPLPEPAIQYADVSAWQREHLTGDVLQGQLAYWKRELAGIPALLDLPTDRPRPALQTFNGAGHTFGIGRRAGEALDAVVRAEGATPFMGLLAAFSLLLSRYAGQDDVVVGSPIAGRGRTDLEGIVGFFVNALPLRTDLSGDPTFRQVLARVREATLGAFAHQDVPFEKLVEELDVERSIAHTPVFQVMFAMQNTAASPVGGGAGDLEAHIAAADAGDGPASAKFDLSVSMQEVGGGFGGGIEYNTDLFDAATIRRLGRHFAALVEAAATRPDVPVSRLSMLGAEERTEVVDAWNHTEAPYRTDATLHGLFAEQAARTPDAVAVAWGGGEMTYAELDVRANRLAHRLRALGVGPDVPVAISVDRSPEMVVAVLGTLKAGGGYVPVDPAYPRDRRAYMLRDCGAPVVLVRAHLAADLPETEAAVVVLDGVSDDASLPASAPDVPVSPDHLAYVIYTSGSTGKPKGCVVRHGGVVNLVQSLAPAFGVDGESRVLNFASFSFDMTVLDVFTALTTGAALHVAEPDALMPGEPLARTLRERGITNALLPPSALAVMDDAGFPALRTLVTGGETCPAEVARRWSAGRTFVNAYGPTEITVCATFSPGEDGSRRPAIGRAVANTRLYVLDAAMQPVPVGVSGELYVGGAGVIRGYLGRAALTAERFVPDPFVGDGGRLYATGDRVRWLPGGEIDFLGRVDEQVKVRGFRIEPGEIEAALRDHPTVADAVVVARRDAGDTRLAGYVVPAAGETIDLAELRAHLGRRLPDYMVPAALTALDAFPLAPSGKIDRRGLPAPEWASAAAFVAPRTETERVVAGIWGDLLGHARVGVDDDFFALGGHSLLATRVVSRIRDALGVEVPLRTLFEEPTVARLAAWLGGGAPAVDAADAAPIPRIGAVRAPASFAQERLWFFDRLLPGSVTYNMQTVLPVRGADPAVLGRVLTELARRHESLRTTFEEDAGHAVQVIHPAGDVPLKVVDVTYLPVEEREGEVRRIVGEEANRPFDLQAGPLFRVTLVDGGDAQLVILGMHHIVGDGWSLGVLQRELTALYGAFAAGEPSPLAEPSLQYADFATWQRARLSGDALDRQVAYWKGEMAGAPPMLELPTDRPRPAVQTFVGASVAVAVGRRAGEALAAVAREEQATPFMAMLAAFSALLGRYAGADDVVVGSPIAGRTRTEVEELIGFFVNTLVLRADLSGNPSFRELLGRVRRATLGAYAHQDVPFERLVEELAAERALDHSPLFQVMFALQNTGDIPDIDPDTVDLGDVPPDTASAKFDLSLLLAEAGEGFVGTIEFNTDLFDEATVRRLGRHLALLAERAASNPDAPLSSLSLLDEGEEAETGYEALPQYPDGLTIHSLFEARAAERPDAVALVHGGERVTYGALNARANRIAHHLRSMGVGPETLVGVCMERTPDLVASLLGVLKAGGGYVPLDPAYPADRIAATVEDAHAGVILTRSSAASSIPSTGARVVSVDVDAELAGRPETDPAPLATEGNVAYTIFTSGSTGRPKGVAIEHRSVVAFLHWFRGEMTDDDLGGMLGSTSIAFDVSIAEIFGTLSWGGRLVLVDNALGLPDVAGEDIRVATMVPSAAAELVRVGGVPTTVRAFNLGGEALPASLADSLHALGHVDVIRNLYGPTEDTTYSTIARVPAGGGKVRVGRPVAGTHARVLDDTLRPVPVGVPGEIWLAGAGLTRGYLNRPGMTAERYVPDPHGPPGSRMYRTGDRGRWLADGELEYLGRLDHQVKVRGFRIEPGEVEAVLRRHPSVGDAVVIARESAPGDVRLVAYLVPAAGEAIDAAALRAHVRAAMPEYMVPSYFVPLDAFPRTPNGKLDRRSLPAPEPAAGDEAAYVAPRDETEATLAEVWAEVLGRERVGANDSFFDLGGHSLLLVQVQSRLRERLGRDVPMVTLFRYPTIRALADHLAGDDGGDRATEVGQERADARRALRSRRRDRRGGGGEE